MRAAAASRLGQSLALAFTGVLVTSAQARLASAQQATFLGRVLDAATERPIAGALIELRDLKLTAQSDSAGNFRIRKVEAGVHIAVIRAIGYDSIVARLQLAPNDSSDSDFMLAHVATALPAAIVKAPASKRYAIQLQEFEERRALPFGTFLEAQYFEKNSGRNVGVLLVARVPGIRITPGTKAFIVSSRTSTRSGSRCLAQTIVNGILREPLDLNAVNADDIIGFEYYTTATTPVKYNVTGQKDNGPQCGTAIFWMK